jgi:uncharacterized protein (DUF1015 family)
MARIYPFRAVRPPQERVAEVSSPPYDVMNTEEAREMARGNPLSFLHVSRPEIDLPEGTDMHSPEVYDQAARAYRELKTACPLMQDDEPSVYLYQLQMGDHIQTGIVTAASVDEYDEDLIRKHERTRPDKEDDRTRHMISLHAQTGPVFLTYRADRRIDSLVEGATHAEPLYNFTSADGVRHTVWRVTDTAPFVRAFEAVSLLYIADGHHRAASASRARAELRDKNPNHTGDEDYNRFLTVAFPDDQMQILSYHRAVKDLGELMPGEFMHEVTNRFDAAETASPEPKVGELCCMYTGGVWYALTLKDASTSDSSNPVASLDVQRLEDNILKPILNIQDVRTDKRIDFVGGIRGTRELERLVDSGKAAVAFSMRPTSIEDLLRVSDAKSIMPPKSTWFEPKLRDGLLIHEI